MKVQFGKPKVLIVDDISENIRVLIETLGKEYITLVAKGGEAALEKINQVDDIDLILLDIMMPGIDGYEVCRRLKEDSKTKNIPIIFITAINDTSDEASAFELGAVDYVTKPFTPIVVKARVKTHIELKRKTDKLEAYSSVDGLTGIYNRRKFDAVYVKEWQRSYREKQSLALILIDIDHFKRYNDTYGHIQGDECLKQVALCLFNTIKRATDFLGRFGGEEFVVLLPSTELNGARLVAERLRNEVSKLQIPHRSSPVEKYITISVGAATTFPHAQTMSPNQLLKMADTMLYAAKDNGRNCVKSHTE